MNNNFINEKSKSSIISFQTQVLKTYADIIDNLSQGKDLTWHDDEEKESIPKKDQEENYQDLVLNALRYNKINYTLKNEGDSFKYTLKSNPSIVKATIFTYKIFNGVEDFINVIKKHLVSDSIKDYMLYMPLNFIKDDKIYYKLIIDREEAKTVEEQFEKLKDLLTCKNTVRDAVLSNKILYSSDEQKDIIEKYQKMLIADENNVITNLEDVLNKIDKDLGGK